MLIGQWNCAFDAPFGLLPSLYHCFPSMPTPNLQTLFRLFPLVPLTICFIGGIAFGESMDTFRHWIGPLLIAVVLLFSALSLLRRPLLNTLLLLLLAFSTGILSVSIANRMLSAPGLPRLATLDAVVVDEPVTVGRATVRADLVILSGELSGRGVRAYFLAGSDGEEKSISVGDGVVFRSLLCEPRTYSASSPFYYAGYLKSRGIVATAQVSPDCWRKASLNLSRLPLLSRARLSALRLRHRIESHYARLGLSGQSLAVSSAMVLGNKSAVSASVRDAYSVAGTSHVLALSGLHLSIIYTLLSLLSLGRKGWAVNELVTVAAMWCYVFMVGLSPSVVRAAIMVTVYSIVGLTGRRGASLNVLAFAALLMLVVNPFSLFDLGFQLSFASMTFILAFHWRLSAIVPLPFQQRHPVVRFFWQLVLLSAIATVGTLPLVVAYFGRFPVYFLVANIIVVPAATLIIYAFLALPLLSLVPVVGGWAVSLLGSVVDWVNAALAFIASWPCASVAVPPMSPLQTVILYVAVVSLFVAVSTLLHRHRSYWL